MGFQNNNFVEFLAPSNVKNIWPKFQFQGEKDFKFAKVWFLKGSSSLDLGKGIQKNDISE